uniref:Uncharacterized protein n=1 Tax=Anguilla anguilla TaxID=7936 RepID=A0A0E9SJ01_ANGAN
MFHDITQVLFMVKNLKGFNNVSLATDREVTAYTIKGSKNGSRLQCS